MLHEMHISESQKHSNTILTKCSKMNEEGHKRHGMNGNADGAVKEESPSECPKANYVPGGRLKFFKDGKFILELERAREGERVSWVSVPRKTFWPPQGTAASTPTYRQESSASLSVSDDNSSIQSSPWQRDHSWKQTTPRRNMSKNLSFFYRRSKLFRLKTKSRMRRQPYLNLPEPEDVKDIVLCSDRTTNKSACNNMVNNSHKRPALLTIIQNLIEKNASRTPPRGEMVVSPRKRFLREMEKDKVQVEDGCQKRSRNKVQQAQVATSGVTTVKASSSPVQVNGSVEDVKPPRNCSYSITSLLADDRNTKRSPSNSPSHFASAAQTQYCSPKSEDRWYSESVDRLRSIELSQADKRSFSSYPHHSYLPPYMYPYSLPTYYNPSVYGRGYVIPPVYHHTPSLNIPVLRRETPSCSWTPEPTPDLDHKEDNITDMPLNLSKHAG